MGVDQHAAEGSLVRLAAENDRAGIAGFPYPGSAVGGLDCCGIQRKRRFTVFQSSPT